MIALAPGPPLKLKLHDRNAWDLTATLMYYNVAAAVADGDGNDEDDDDDDEDDDDDGKR